MDTRKPIESFGENGKVNLTKAIPRAVNARNYAVTSPPLICRDVVVVGSSISDGPTNREMPRGDVQAFDVRTGKPAWIFHTVPQEGEFGVDSWENESWKYTGNTNPWTILSADDELGYVYIPIGTPTNDWYGGHRLGNNLFAESLVCLDAKTGKRIWHFQSVHQLAVKERRGVLQSFECMRSLLVRTEMRDKHGGMPQVLAHPYFRDGHQPLGHTRVFHLAQNQLADFGAKQFVDPGSSNRHENFGRSALMRARARVLMDTSDPALRSLQQQARANLPATDGDRLGALYGAALASIYLRDAAQADTFIASAQQLLDTVDSGPNAQKKAHFACILVTRKLVPVKIQVTESSRAAAPLRRQRSRQMVSQWSESGTPR